jgi:putative FmdB family regulatory protein
MPIYEYAPIAASCEHCRGRFEALQRMADPELTACPECGQPCQRVISAPSIAVGGSHLLKENHFSKHGFTQYKRVQKGKYEKTAGNGPDTLSGD